MRHEGIQHSNHLRHISRGGGSFLQGPLGLLAISLIVAACNTASPTPTPTATQAAPTPTPGSDLAAVLRQHYDAVNKGDVASIMATFTNDAVVVRGTGCTPPQAPCVGKPAIQTQLERELRGQPRYGISDIQVSGNAVSARAEWRGTPILNAGLERVIVNITATFSSDRISRIVHDLDLRDSQSAAFTNFLRISSVVGPRDEALNRGDVSGVMVHFSETAVFEGFGACVSAPCASKAAIQKEMERQIADKTRITGVPESARVAGDVLTLRAELRSDSIRAAGVERVIVARTTEVKGDKITILRYVLDATDPQTATYLKSLGK